MRHPTLLLMALLCAGPSLAADAADPKPVRDLCIDSQRISGWEADGDRAIIVTVGAGRRYRLELGLAASVVDVDSQARLAFIPRHDGRLCAGWGHVGVDGRRIPIRTITALPADKPAATEK